ncbi:hypothetical protein HYR69_04100 [Candidatus Sumerlaeota bacterium]|nr:hypothetical protein [Candidatus Sumerlaeota bacterium]
MSHSSLASNRIAIHFEHDLRSQARRLAPLELIPTILRRLAIWENQGESAQSFPPHAALRLIEANCAYFRPNYSCKPVDAKRLDSLLRFIVDYPDPYLKFLLAQKDMELLSIALAWQQFYFQKRPNIHAIGRALRLFDSRRSLRSTSEHIRLEHGFTLDEFIFLCFAIYSLWQKRVEDGLIPRFVYNDIYNSDVPSVPKHALEPILKCLSNSIEDTGRAYTVLRNNSSDLPPFLRIFALSSFLEKPLLILPDRRSYLISMRNLLLQATWRIPYVLAEGVGSFGDEFGGAFEKYVGDVLTELAGKQSVLDEAAIKKNSSSRSCDYIVELDDAMLLLECKATMYAGRIATEKAIQDSNLISKISDAIIQLHSTGSDLPRIRLPLSKTALEKKVLPFVVVFDDIEAMNSEWMWNSILMPRLRKKGLDEETCFRPFHCKPQIISVESLESIVRLTKAQPRSVAQLVEEKLAKNYWEIGDWWRYTMEKLKPYNTDTNTFLEVSKREFAEFMRRYGIPSPD